MRVTCLVCSYGAPEWRDLAMSRAFPSALDQGFFDVVAVHDPDATLSEVRNGAAAAAVASDALVFLDADDELEPGFFAAMESLLDHKAGDLLVPAVRYVFPDGRESPAAIPQKGRWPVLNECVIGTLVPRGLFLALGGFRDCLDSLEDYDLWLRCYEVGAKLVHVEQAVYRAYVNPDGRNRDQSTYARVWDDHLVRIGERSA